MIHLFADMFSHSLSEFSNARILAPGKTPWSIANIKVLQTIVENLVEIKVFILEMCFACGKVLGIYEKER